MAVSSPPVRSHPPRRAALRAQVVLLGVLTALALIAASFSWYRVAHTLKTARPVKVPTIHPVTGVVWGDRVFNSRQALTAWLNARGASYARWASRNPDLARVFAAK